MKWIARRCSEHDMVDEAYICLTLAGVMVSGLMTDPIAIHSIFGAFGFGLTIPEGEFAEALIGLKTDVATIRGGRSRGLLVLVITTARGGRSWGLLVLVITTACAGKIIGTFVVAMMLMIPA
ncbi:hypothetical protein H0E87_019406 [Populus deltoides]|uniref:Uncharacterized protein n=1 Tax=Populus deltoides TaxID=3696 RepID=A0A8T2XUX8_POPDE|nr:hypothetical protein H0E87_019406 [Populus deltoides]